MAMQLTALLGAAICSPDGERIALRSHGNEVEIGVGLVKRDKILLARYLAAQLRQRPI